MRIIFLGDSIATQRTGIHYYGRQLVQSALTDYPMHEYSIVLPKADGHFEMEEIIVPLKERGAWYMRFRQLVTIPSLLRKLHPDMVIELAHFGPFRLPSAIARVTIIHDLTPLLFPEFHSFLSSWMHKLLLPGIVKRADHIVVNSNCTGRDLTRIYPAAEGKVLTFYPRIIGPDKSEGRLEKEQPDRPYFLTVGTIEPRKNHLTILRAFESFCQKNENYDLIIVGKEGWKNQAFFESIATSAFRDRIQYRSYIDRATLWQLYQNAYAFIFASFYEGFGLPILEAMSFGLPVIVANNSSLRELVDGHGLLFQADRPQELLKCMNQVLDLALHQKLIDKSIRRYQAIEGKYRSLDFLA